MLRAHDERDAVLFRRFIGRIRAWQAFMERGRDEVLGIVAEVGLVGELLFLEQLLDVGVSAAVAVGAWRGPLNGLHDFVLGVGAMEVKACVASGTFPAVVGSLEQLDDSSVQPLFLVGVKLALDASGRTLPVIVNEVGDRLRRDSAAYTGFEDLVLEAGFLAAVAEDYHRRFWHTDTAILPVGGEFPRLTRGNVARPIRDARYELDLDMVDVAKIPLDRALTDLQVL